MFYFYIFCIFSYIPVILCDPSCKEPLLRKCICGEAEYILKKQFIVNCTNTGFNTTKPLEKLPNNTQVLIFTGNNIPEVPANVFGLENNNSHLRVVDMSNNKFKIIHGKAFHKVSSVERLILNHNEININEPHVRVFSNFENLLELHLTDAFANMSEHFTSNLHTIFINSGLLKLRKLHLEQNKLRTFEDPLVFCDLDSLMDLHLGDNKLQHINFRLDCLKHLRFLDLERNAFVYLSKDELSKFDIFPRRKQNFTIDLSDNPFSCGYQIEEFFSWLNSTAVEVRGKNKLKCKYDPKSSKEPLLLSLHDCHLRSKQSAARSSPDSTVTTLSLLLILAVGLLLYTNAEAIRNKLYPIVRTLSRKVHYTNIGKNEVHEMEV